LKIYLSALLLEGKDGVTLFLEVLGFHIIFSLVISL